MILVLNFTKGHNSIKTYVELHFLFSAHLLLMPYIRTKCHENTCYGFNDVEQEK